MTPKDDRPWIVEMIQQNDDKHEEAHQRIRLDVRVLDADHRALKTEVVALKVVIGQLTTALAAQQTAPVDVGKIVGNWKVLATLAGMITANLAGNWFSNAPVRESQARMQESISVMQVQIEGGTKLQDTRTSGIKESVDGLNRQMEMRRLEIQSLANEVQQLRRGR